MNSQKRVGQGGGPSKRPRTNNEDEDEMGGTFEEHLASLVDEEAEYDMEDWNMGATEAEGPQQEATLER